MGRYLNSSTSYVLYKNETMKPYFVDKTKLLSELFPFLEVGNTHICITRPRRFGKTMIANMIASFLGKRKSENGLFESLNISQNKEYIKYKNQYDGSFNDFLEEIKRCNGLSSDTIYAGNHIIVPVVIHSEKIEHPYNS